MFIFKITFYNDEEKQCDVTVLLSKQRELICFIVKKIIQFDKYRETIYESGLSTYGWSCQECNSKFDKKFIQSILNLVCEKNPSQVMTPKPNKMDLSLIVIMSLKFPAIKITTVNASTNFS